MFELLSHTDHPGVAVGSITVSIERSGDILSLSYTVTGDLDRVLWRDAVTPSRSRDLWQHTCFEAFVQPAGGAGYIELNLSPSMCWATYAFDGYRAGMRDATAMPMSVHWAMPTLAATIDLSEIGGVGWQLGLTAVIEETDGTKSYWALAHAPGPPDFHNRDCFIATLPAPDAT